ncbi:MAG TPA: DUF4129 domain-containing protein [Chryseosolibacter sp.]
MRLFLLLLGVGFCLSLRAQPFDSLNDAPGEEGTAPLHEHRKPGELATTRNYNAEAIGIRSFDEKKWREAVGDADFRETPSAKQEKASSANYSLPWAGAVLKIISYIAIPGIVIFLLYLVLKDISFDVKIRRSQLRTDDLEKPPENIEDIDISGQLDQARREGNFRLAVRLYYLALLKKLHEMQVIAWKKDKTNRDYLTEVFSKDFHFLEMQGLTVSYEAIWYGEHQVNAVSFQDLSSRFEAVFQKIDNRQTP